jgi:hypothetical protein
MTKTMTSCNNCIDDTIDICCHNLQITCQLSAHVSVWYFLFQIDLTIRSTFSGVRVSHITVDVCVGWATQSKDCIDNINNNDTCYRNFDIHMYLWYSHINYQSMYKYLIQSISISSWVYKYFCIVSCQSINVCWKGFLSSIIKQLSWFHQSYILPYLANYLLINYLFQRLIIPISTWIEKGLC